MQTSLDQVTQQQIEMSKTVRPTGPVGLRCPLCDWGIPRKPGGDRTDIQLMTAHGLRDHNVLKDRIPKYRKLSSSNFAACEADPQESLLGRYWNVAFSPTNQSHSHEYWNLCRQSKCG